MNLIPLVLLLLLLVGLIACLGCFVMDCMDDLAEQTHLTKVIVRLIVIGLTLGLTGVLICVGAATLIQILHRV